MLLRRRKARWHERAIRQRDGDYRRFLADLAAAEVKLGRECEASGARLELIYAEGGALVRRVPNPGADLVSGDGLDVAAQGASAVRLALAVARVRALADEWASLRPRRPRHPSRPTTEAARTRDGH